ncbi:hypothetical protein [Bartonella rochalimae]|uniref:hypothetical protein n=1 Tax=Bartonella rochalimae TaxID=395923 RepID=UPI00054D67A9|nr:hypothetical protein [Bartonella rochalimae]
MKANKEDISKALRMLSCGLKIPQRSDYEGIALAYGMALETVSSWSLMRTVKRILCGEIDGLSDTFFPSTHELVKLCHALENELLSKANLVRKAVMRSCERGKASPLRLVERLEFEDVLNGFGEKASTK